MRGVSAATPWKTRLFSALILAAMALPLLIFWAYVVWINPSRNYYTVDTEFPYFLNSLSVFKGGAYTYTDHPGTPLEEIGTAILGVTYPFLARTPEGFVTFHLQNFGVFLDAAHDFLILANLACFAVLFWVARRDGSWREALGAVVVAGVYFAVHPSSLIASTVWNHNSFSFPFGALLLVALYGLLDRAVPGKPLPVWQVVLLGFGAGVLASVQIFLAAWFLGLLISITVYLRLQGITWRKTIATAVALTASALAGFGVAVLPIARKLPIFWNWILSIFTHQSRYLAVPEDQPLPTRLSENLVNFKDILPLLFAAVAVAVFVAILGIILSRRRLRQRAVPAAVSAGLAVQLIALCVVFLDHPLRDAYFLAVAAILPVLVLALLRLWEQEAPVDGLVRAGLALLVFAGVLWTSVQSVSAKAQEVSTLRLTEAQITRSLQAYAQAVGKPPQDLVILWMYGSYAPCWGLRTGDALTSNTFADELDRICPNQYRLGLNLRYDVHGDAVAPEDGKWDMIFTCDQYLRRLGVDTSSAHLDTFPSIQWGCGAMSVVRHQ